MLEIDFLKKYYKGNGIKVALIDDGTTNKKVYKNISLLIIMETDYPLLMPQL